MKRTFGIVAVLAILGVGAYVGGQVWGQQGGGTAPAPLQTRIAVINMVQVLKDYTKFKNAEAMLKEVIKKDEAALEPKRAEFAKKRGDLATTTDVSIKTQLEHDLRRMQVDLTEEEEKYRKELAKQQGDLAVQIFHEVEDAVQRFAKYNNIELVLFYNDAPKDDKGSPDYYSPQNVQRKLMTLGAVMPMYYVPQMDISANISDMLNKQLAAAPQ